MSTTTTTTTMWTTAFPRPPHMSAYHHHNAHPHVSTVPNPDCYDNGVPPSYEEEDPNVAEGRFSRLRTSIGYWKKSIFGGCVFMNFSRSRRKPEVHHKEERQNNANAPALASSNKKTGVVSFSQVSAAKARKAPSSDTCVADSFDDQMLEKLVALPHGMDRNEWLATHILALFEHVNALCGTVSEVCTPVTCPIMCYPGTSKAYWFDERGKRHQYSAMRYIDCVMSFCEASRKNQSLFPTKYGATFSSDFELHCRRVIRLLWHCCGHLYSKHWDQLALLNLRPQCSLVLAHMQRIAKHFTLLDSKELSTLTNTLYLVRPPYLQAPPAKRAVGEANGDENSQPGGVTRWTRVPASKSGSWGGYPTPGATLSCKPFAQTC